MWALSLLEQSPTRVFSRPATGCGGGARILDFRGMNPALYCLSYTATNEKAQRGEPGGACVGFFFRRVALRKQGKSYADAD